jgi:hypothetical protein
MDMRQCRNTANAAGQFHSGGEGIVDHRSRVRIAAVAWVIAAGFLVGGAVGAVATADPGGNGGRSHGQGGYGGGKANTAGDARGYGGKGYGADSLGGSDRSRPADPKGDLPGGGNLPAGNGQRGKRDGGVTKLGGENPPVEKPPVEKPPVEQPPVEQPPDDNPGQCERSCPDPGPVPGPNPNPTGNGNGGGYQPPQLQQPGEPGGTVAPKVVGTAAGTAVAVVPVAVVPPVIPLPLMLQLVWPPVPGAADGGVAPSVLPPESAPGGASHGAGQPLPAPREPWPADTGRTAGMQASFRAGYSEFLRAAEVSQMAAVALPGFAGMLLLTAGGGFIGYRQAKAGHVVHTEIGRFLS